MHDGGVGGLLSSQTPFSVVLKWTKELGWADIFGLIDDLSIVEIMKRNLDIYSF